MVISKSFFHQLSSKSSSVIFSLQNLPGRGLNFKTSKSISRTDQLHDLILAKILKLLGFSITQEFFQFTIKGSDTGHSEET
jgi:hypothetical protein